MGVWYPCPVSRHNLVCPLLLYPDCPRLGPFCHDGGRFATTVVVGAFGRHGATHDLAQRGVGRSGWESVMGNRAVWLEHRLSTSMGVQGHGFHGAETVR